MWKTDIYVILVT